MVTQENLNGFMWTAKRLGWQISSINGDFCVKAFGFELYRDDFGQWSLGRYGGIYEHPCA